MHNRQVSLKFSNTALQCQSDHQQSHSAIQTKHKLQIFYVFHACTRRWKEKQKLILTDQSRDAVQLRVIGTFSFPRIHFTRFKAENVFL